jgi:hypothetical protein
LGSFGNFTFSAAATATVGPVVNQHLKKLYRGVSSETGDFMGDVVEAAGPELL